MDFAYALTYIYEDKEWIGKIAPLGLLMLLAVIPLAGLLPLALALGYMMQIAINVRNGLPRPLPKWHTALDMLQNGGQILLLVILINLPPLVFGACMSWLITGVSSGFLDGITSLVTLCCVLPLSLVYYLMSWSMLAIALCEYIETGELSAVLRPIHLFDVLRTHHQLVRQWVLAAFLANLCSAALALIPCFGWMAVMLFTMPVHGHLLGQFALKLGAVNRPQRRQKRPQ